MLCHLKRFSRMSLLLLIASCSAPRQDSRPALLVAPTQSQMLALLNSGDFAELDRLYGTLQHEYETRSISDGDLRASFRVFYLTDPALAHQYDAWVRHSPNSYVAHLARGIYYDFLGADRRGEASAGETSAEQFQGMYEAFAVAVADFKLSMSLTRRPILTYLYRLRIDRYVGNQSEAREVFEDAMRIDPHSFIVREMYMMALSTQWGGSQDAMKQFLEASREAGLSDVHLRVLESAIVADQAWIELFEHKDYAAAARAYLHAYEIDGESGCLRCAAEAFLQAEDYGKAIDTYSRLLAAKPNDTDAMHRRGWVFIWHSATPQAGIADFQRAADLGDPQGNVDLAHVYLTGKTVPPDRDHATELLKPAVAAGYAPAKNLLDLINLNAFPAAGANSKTH